MSTELLIISDAVDFGPALGIALAQRGAWRVTLVSDGESAREARPQGMVLLDSDEEQAGSVIARQLHEYGFDVPVLCSSRDAGLEAALARLEPAAASPADIPLEPLAGNESDAASWRYVNEPDFLRSFVADAIDSAATDPDSRGRQEKALPAAGERDEAAAATGMAPGDASTTTPGLADLAQKTGARFALLEQAGEELARFGELDAITEADLRAPGRGGTGQGSAQLFLLETWTDREPCLLYVCNAGPLRLSLLAPDDVPVRDLRRACGEFLGG